MILNTVPRQSSISDGLRAEIRASIGLLSEILPDYNIIKEALERQFPEGMVVRRMGYQEQNEQGEVEFLLREDRAAIQFSARQLAYPPTSHSPGQPRFFKEHIVLSISAGQEFRGSGGPFGGSCGLYAYDGQRLTHIDGGDAEQRIGEVLRSESLDLDHVDPAELALFFCHTVIPGFRGQHTVVAPSADAVEYSPVTEPSVTRVEGRGWILHFWTLKGEGGCSPGVPTLCEHRVAYLPAMTSTTGNFRCQIWVFRDPFSGNLSQVAGAVAPCRPGFAKPLAVNVLKIGI